SGTEPPDLELPESGQSESEELPSELADNPNSTPEQPEILPPANNLGGADGREAGGSDSSLSELGESDSAGGDFANPGDGDGLRESGAESEAAPAESDRGGNDQAIATENGGDAAADFFDWSRPDGENPVSVDDLGLGEDFLSWAEAGESAMDFDFWSETADGQGERDRIPGLDGLAAEVADTREIFSLLSGLLSELDSRLPGLSPEEHDSFRPLRDKLALSGKARLGEMAGLLRNLSVQLRFRRENPDLNPVLVESLIISLVDRIENTVERLWLDTMRAAALAYAAGEEGGKTPAKAFDLMEKGTLAMRGNLAEYRRRLDGFAKWQRRNRVTYREQ
ncbi:MAG: hypothetical protein LBU64_01865, partial [Planctomycetota bacterium]|nr:hypothetical protein [Planctomycetota bacterium]